MSNGKSVVGAVLQQTYENLEKGPSSSQTPMQQTLGINKNEQTKVKIVAVRVF